MSVNSPCRIPYSKWRLQVFQQLFSAAVPLASPVRTKTVSLVSRSRKYHNATTRNQQVAVRTAPNDDRTSFNPTTPSIPRSSNPRRASVKNDIPGVSQRDADYARSPRVSTSPHHETSPRTPYVKDQVGQQVGKRGNVDSHEAEPDDEDNTFLALMQSSNLETGKPVDSSTAPKSFAPINQSPLDVDGLIAALDQMITQQEADINRLDNALGRGKIVRRIVSADEPEEYLEFRVRWVSSAPSPEPPKYDPELELSSLGGTIISAKSRRAETFKQDVTTLKREQSAGARKATGQLHPVTTARTHSIIEASPEVRSDHDQAIGMKESAEAVSEKKGVRAVDLNAGVPQTATPSPIAISPLERHIDRARNRLVKPHPAEVEAEQKFRHNPWALMLAGSVRLCAGSKLRVSHPLLDDFNFAVHTEDDGTFLLPQRLADLTLFKQEITNNRTTDFKPPRDTRGRVIRIIPDQLLVSQLSRRLTMCNNKKKIREAKPNAVAGRLLPAFWLDENTKRRTYENASKGYWAALEAQGGSKDEHQQRQQSIDYSRLKWVPDLDERLLLIMRQRVLIALDAIGEMESRSDRRMHRTTLQVPEHGGGRRLGAEGADLVVISEAKDDGISGEAVKMEMWNDMGDIESEDAITGVGNKQGCRKDGRPPIAVRPDEITMHEPVVSGSTTVAGSSHVQRDGASRERDQAQNDTTTSETNTSPEDIEPVRIPMHERYSDDPTRWLPGSIILDLNNPTQSPYRDLYESASRHTNAETTSIDHYLPPTATITINDNNPHQIPVFPIQALLQRPDLLTLLEQIHHKHPALHSDPAPQHDKPTNTNAPKHQNKLVLFKATGQKTHALALEIWRLWRYTGGARCLGTLQPGAGLSEAQMQRLVELCGVA